MLTRATKYLFELVTQFVSWFMAGGAVLCGEAAMEAFVPHYDSPRPV